MTAPRLPPSPSPADLSDMQSSLGPRRHRTGRVLGHAAVLLVALAVVVSTAAVTARSAGASTGSDESAMFALTNQTRASVGLPALQWDPAAGRIAREWAQHLAAVGVLSHNPDLANQITTQVTASWSRIGENAGFGPSPAVLEPLFVNSPAHYANIVGPYNRVGVGSARDAHGAVWVVLDFVSGPAIASSDPNALLPFGTASELVTQQYLDLLGRWPDPAGLAYWTDQLDRGAIGGPDVAASFLTSSEFAGSVGPLAKLYLAAFGRLPDAQGLLYWLSVERSGRSLSEIAAMFGTTYEYATTFGAGDPVSVVTGAYPHVFGRQVDSGGLAYWSGLIASGALSPTDFLLQLARSSEFATKVDAQVQVAMVYIGLLRRSGDPAGFSYWLNQVRGAGTLGWMTRAFFGTPEYAGRF